VNTKNEYKYKKKNLNHQKKKLKNQLKKLQKAKFRILYQILNQILVNGLTRSYSKQILLTIDTISKVVVFGKATDSKFVGNT